MHGLRLPDLPVPVRRASQLAGPTGTGEVDEAGVVTGGSAGADRLLPVAAALRPVLPGLRRGATIAVSPPAGSLLMALLAGGSGAGCWSAVVGMPQWGALAAAEAGVALERLALVPFPGPRWPAVVAALLDGVDVVVIAPPGPVPAELARRLAARARLRGSVLLPYGQWPGAEFTLTVDRGQWHGLSAGHGRLRRRESTITGSGRGAAARPRRVRVQLPDPAGRLGSATTGGGRPRLTVIDGGGGDRGRGELHQRPHRRAA